MTPYLYVLTTDALGYFLEYAGLQGENLRHPSPNGSETVNNHFSNDSPFYEC